MDKKRILSFIIAFIVIAIIAVVVVVIVNNKGETVNYKETQFEVGDYKVELKSKLAGHSESGYNFVTRYSKKYECDNYDLDFGIRVLVSAKNESVYNTYSDYNSLNEVGIFNKRFKYKAENKKVKLLYKYDDNFYIEIDLKDASDYLNKDGSLLKTTSNVEDYNFFEKLTQDSEFRNFLSFNISKK
jgi:hypothetical protein